MLFRSPTISLSRNSDGYYWSGSAFQAGYTAVNMSELDATNLPGIYYYDWDYSSDRTTAVTIRIVAGSTDVMNTPQNGEFNPTLLTNVTTIIPNRILMHKVCNVEG